ncbi:NOT2/NOT3/NOT5 [Cinara cedri]|uniref:NOT2/NOT3/NOT5 n=1 Tax=Cinara cedri TaxID=506608 RepID=A0A5E4N8A6_9HEMI|nr:NOT2/NOT3/NOT5 [Cinara cedri]
MFNPNNPNPNNRSNNNLTSDDRMMLSNNFNLQLQQHHQSTLFTNNTTMRLNDPLASTSTNYQENFPYLMPHPMGASSLVNNMLNHINGMNSSNCSLFNSDDIFPIFNTQSGLDNSRMFRDNAISLGPNVQTSNSAQYSKPEAAERTTYAKRIKSTGSTVGEFRMRNKDFPALPGTENVNNASTSNVNPTHQWHSKTFGSGNKLLEENCMEPFMNQIFDQPSSSRANIDFPYMIRHTDGKSGVQISPEGKVTNIPGTMLKDQFGIIGQIMTMRAASTDPSLVELSIGIDLTTLGMDLNSPGNNYPTFGGPFKNCPLQPHETEHQVPSEYLIHQKIKDKLAPINFSNFGEDLLFYLFYNHFGDSIQPAVAKELYLRNWRYHTEQRKWITRMSEISVTETDGIIFECGIYNVFDTETWRKIPRKLYVDHSKLENPERET